ncbi:FxsB family radical SAM/SPASM domain protein, partial [Streptomyces hundungensis]
RSGPAETSPRHGATWCSRRTPPTARAVEVLLGSGSLTDLGERFVGRMGETVADWRDEPVSPAAFSAAEESARRHRAAWEARAEGRTA